MRCLKSSMIDNKHWNMYLLYILLHSISPSIHPLFTIRSWSILTLSYSIIPTSVGLFPGHRPVDAYCLSIIYSCYFSLNQWPSQVSTDYSCSHGNGADRIILTWLACQNLSAPMRHLYSCRSYTYVRLYAIKLFMRTYRLDLLSYWINHACLFLVNAEVSVYIQSWSVWWCQL